MPATTHAQRTGGQIKGFGTASCGVYLERSRTPGFASTYGQWALGYVAGYNMFSLHPQVEVPDVETVTAYQEKYCRSNPLKPAYFGVIELIGELGGWQPTSVTNR